ncbi:MAG: hypothetical protein WBS21_24045, partial [Candidatus Acidiferrum sp.]
DPSLRSGGRGLFGAQDAGIEESQVRKANLGHRELEDPLGERGNVTSSRSGGLESLTGHWNS